MNETSPLPDILRLLSLDPPVSDQREIAERLNLQRETLFSLLEHLREQGFIKHDDQRKDVHHWQILPAGRSYLHTIAEETAPAAPDEAHPRPDQLIELLRTTEVEPAIRQLELLNRPQLLRSLRRLTIVPGTIGMLADHLYQKIPHSDADIVMLSEQLAAELPEVAAQLENHRQALLIFLRQYYGEDDAETLYVRLPDSSGDPREVSGAFKDIIISFDNVVQRISGDKLTVVGARHGSIWLQLLVVRVASAVGQSVVYAILKLYFWWRQQRAAAAIFDAEARRAGVAAKEFEAISDVRVKVARMHGKALVDKYKRDDHVSLDECTTHLLNFFEAMERHAEHGARLSLSAKAEEWIKAELPKEAGGVLPGLPASPELVQPALPVPDDESDK